VSRRGRAEMSTAAAPPAPEAQEQGDQDSSASRWIESQLLATMATRAGADQHPGAPPAAFRGRLCASADRSHIDMGMDVGEDEDCACCALEAPRCRNGLRIGLGSAFGTAIAGAGVFCPPTGGTAAHPHTLPGGFVARLGRSAARSPATARDPDCGCQRKCLGQFIVNHKDIYTRLVSSIDMHRLGTEQSKSEEDELLNATRGYQGSGKLSVLRDGGGGVAATPTLDPLPADPPASAGRTRPAKKDKAELKRAKAERKKRKRSLRISVDTQENAEDKNCTAVLTQLVQVRLEDGKGLCVAARNTVMRRASSHTYPRLAAIPGGRQRQCKPTLTARTAQTTVCCSASCLPASNSTLVARLSKEASQALTNKQKRQLLLAISTKLPDLCVEARALIMGIGTKVVTRLDEEILEELYSGRAIAEPVHGNASRAPANRLPADLHVDIHDFLNMMTWFDPAARTKDGMSVRRPTSDDTAGIVGLWAEFSVTVPTAADQMDESTFRRHIQEILAVEHCKMLGATCDHNVCSKCKLYQGIMLNKHQQEMKCRNAAKRMEEGSKQQQHAIRRAEALHQQHEDARAILTAHNARNIMYRSFVHRLVSVFAAASVTPGVTNNGSCVHNDDKTAQVTNELSLSLPSCIPRP